MTKQNHDADTLIDLPVANQQAEEAKGGLQNEEALTDLPVTEAQADDTKGGPAVSNNLKQIGIGCHNIASTY